MRKLTGLFLLALGLAGAAVAQRGEGPLDTSPPKGTTPEEIILRFAAKEKEFKEARENYTYRQEVKVQTMDGNRADGEYQQIVDITFDDRGRRGENVIYAPQSTLRRVQITREDLEDIEKRLPFVLTTDEIPDYNIKYLGQQRVDELQTYVFDVSPKNIDRGRRYFEGRIWVDNLDFQIVKTHGKNVPDLVTKAGENLFPKFTTWREQIDGRYWFPTYTRVDDVLQFKNGDVHIRQIVKYTNYKRFGAKTRIVYEGQEIPKSDGKK